MRLIDADALQYSDARDMLPTGQYITREEIDKAAEPPKRTTKRTKEPPKEPKNRQKNQMRLIDADELLERFVEKGQRSNRYKLGENWELNFPEIYDVVNQQPTIEAEPRAAAHWLEEYKTDDGKMVRCSACRMVYWIGTGREGNYCPNCGAKMDQEQEGEQWED